MVDVLFKLIENPTALGLFALIIISLFMSLRTIVSFSWKVIRSANETNERIINNFNADSEASNNLLDKLVSFLSRLSEATERSTEATHQIGETINRNTVAFEKVAGQVGMFSDTQARFGTELKTALSQIRDDITKLDHGLSTWRDEDRKLIEQMHQKIETILERLPDGTSDSTYPDPAG